MSVVLVGGGAGGVGIGPFILCWRWVMLVVGGGAGGVVCGGSRWCWCWRGGGDGSGVVVAAFTLVLMVSTRSFL